jgi:hypothetical protein
MPRYKPMPNQEFINRQLVTLAGIIKAQKAAAHRRNDRRLPPDNPPPSIVRGEAGNSERRAIGTSYTADKRGHFSHEHKTRHLIPALHSGHRSLNANNKWLS